MLTSGLMIWHCDDRGNDIDIDRLAIFEYEWKNITKAYSGSVTAANNPSNLFFVSKMEVQRLNPLCIM